MLETQAHKKCYFQHYRETKMSQIIVFWSNREIKITRNVVFRLNNEIQKVFKKHPRESRENFMSRKFLPLKFVLKIKCLQKDFRVLIGSYSKFYMTHMTDIIKLQGKYTKLGQQALALSNT